MKIIYGKPHAGGGNFGDDMNVFLWPSLFGNDIFQKQDHISFLGIGTMLSDDSVYNKDWWNSNKVVFGTGIRSNSRNFNIDKTFNLMFLRGPLSRSFIGQGDYITDAAYCFLLSQLYNNVKNVEKTHEIGLIPYFRSMNIVNWKRIAKETSMYLISPCTDEKRSALDVVKEIASCKYIVTEAMHGAIFADILRIPWSRFIFSTYKYEQANVADFKWMDWMYSMDLKHELFPIIPLTCKINNAVYRLSNQNIEFKYIFKSFIEPKIIDTLTSCKYNWQLSNEVVLDKKLVLLSNEMEKFISLYIK